MAGRHGAVVMGSVAALCWETHPGTKIHWEFHWATLRPKSRACCRCPGWGTSLCVPPALPKILGSKILPCHAPKGVPDMGNGEIRVGKELQAGPQRDATAAGPSTQRSPGNLIRAEPLQVLSSLPFPAQLLQLPPVSPSLPAALFPAA